MKLGSHVFQGESKMFLHDYGDAAQLMKLWKIYIVIVAVFKHKQLAGSNVLFYNAELGKKSLWWKTMVKMILNMN